MGERSAGEQVGGRSAGEQVGGRESHPVTFHPSHEAAESPPSGAPRTAGRRVRGTTYPRGDCPRCREPLRQVCGVEGGAGVPAEQRGNSCSGRKRSIEKELSLHLQFLVRFSSTSRC